MKVNFNNNYINSTKCSEYKNSKVASSTNFTGKNSSLLKIIFDPFANSNNKTVNWVTDKIARAYSPVLRSKSVEKFVTKYEKSNIAAHLSAIIATTISALYITKTLGNKKLDTEKRRTLAINQALVAVTSLAGSYGLEKLVAKPIDGYTNKQGQHVDGFVDRFRKANIEYINNLEDAELERLRLKNIKLEEVNFEKINLEELLKNKNVSDSQIESLKETPILKEIQKFLSPAELISAERAKRVNKIIDKWVDGIRVAKTLIIFGFIFRFFAPVVVTPVANAIGSKINSKKQPKAAEQKPAEVKK